MGAWDVGPFDNDEAQDFVNDLEGALEQDPAGGLALLRNALAAGLEGDVDLTGDLAYAAAGVVGVVLGRYRTDQDLDPLLARLEPSAAEPLAPTAARAVQRLSRPGSAWLSRWLSVGPVEDATRELTEALEGGARG